MDVWCFEREAHWNKQLLSANTCQLDTMWWWFKKTWPSPPALFGPRSDPGRSMINLGDVLSKIAELHFYFSNQNSVFRPNGLYDISPPNSQLAADQSDCEAVSGPLNQETVLLNDSEVMLLQHPSAPSHSQILDLPWSRFSIITEVNNL